MTDYLFRLMDCGITPIITHPERYASLSRRAEAYWLLDRDAVHVLATDAHDTVRRPPVLSAAHDVVAHAWNPDVAGTG